ncbi:MAG: RiPP maturation radical SAM C-methyltransferase [Polyangiaceae bacterium]|nr:RiPP maturation radical SAM C-methyltransferase [Polyangiaceae bacterium]
MCPNPTQKPQSRGAISLVAAPFNSFRRPSIQVGLLAAIARDCGWAARTHHLFLDFAAMIGVKLYERIANDRGVAVGDWLFSTEAFGDDAPDRDGSAMLAAFNLKDEAAALAAARRETVPHFVQLAAEEIARNAPQVVGFTSTFQQTAAAIAIARRLRTLLPHVRLLFGGANFERDMTLEWATHVPECELVLSGEADDSFPRLLTALAEDGPLEDVPGLTWRDAKGAVRRNEAAPTVATLDRNPTPDYDEYFARAEFLGLLRAGLRNDVRIPFESARGCWWGERNHCTFCGLNALSMKFRSKSADRVLQELGELSTRHRSYHFEAADNIIERDYWSTLLPRLSAPNTTYDIFYEVKSNLKPDQIRDLATAGIRTIQPGIESLSTPLLKLMRKGVRGLDNVNLLRWSAYHGVAVSWNVLWGVPGEKTQHYEEQAALFRWLHHLQPPVAGFRVWLERYSPLFKDEKTFPTRSRRPERSLDFIVPTSINQNAIAYFFDYELEDTLANGVFDGMAEAIAAWKNAWMNDWKPQLRYFSAPDCVTVEDGRYGPELRLTRLRGRDARVFQALLEKPMRADRLAELIEEPLQRVERSLRILSSQGIVASEGGLHLSLPLPARRR